MHSLLRSHFKSILCGLFVVVAAAAAATYVPLSEEVSRREKERHTLIAMIDREKALMPYLDSKLEQLSAPNALVEIVMNLPETEVRAIQLKNSIDGRLAPQIKSSQFVARRMQNHVVVANFEGGFVSVPLPPERVRDLPAAPVLVEATDDDAIVVAENGLIAMP